MNHQPEIRPAATVILLRPIGTSDGFEVLLLQRNTTLNFASGQWVFPGGKLEDSDYLGRDDLQAAKQAAARESKEEAGITFDASNFCHFAHFTTPSSEQKRFATWFLLGALPGQGKEGHQDICVDESEIVDFQWITPVAAIRAHQQGDLKMLPPTYWCLLQLALYPTLSLALEQAEQIEAVGRVPTFEPRIVKHDDCVHVLLDSDCAHQSGDLNHSGVQHRIISTSHGWKLIELT